MTENPELGNWPKEPGVDLVETGSQIAGGLVGVAVEFLFPGHSGMIAGQVVASGLQGSLGAVVRDVADRLLSRGERVRVGSAASYAVEMYQLRVAAGHSLRQDGFFDEEPSGRTPGNEVAEGVLQASRRAFEERKVRHLGYMFANVGFEDQIDAALANATIGDAEAMTWRQYVLLACVARQDERPLPAEQLNAEPGGWERFGVFRELENLWEADYITSTPDKSARFESPLRNYRINELRLAKRGLLLHDLLSLDLIDDGEQETVRRQLQARSPGT